MRGMTTATPTPSHPDGSIDCEVRDAVLLIGINRPAKRNGFTPKMYRELGEAYTRLDDDPALRVGVLHALGDHFTAGLDLPTIAPLMQRGEKAVPLGLVDPVNLGMDGYRRRTKPMVVAVKGITYTLGIELMLAADIVIAADNCRFSQLEVKRGIMATGGATLRMAERAGLGNALLHLLTGDEFGSAEALRLNFVQKVVPAGTELDEALAIANCHCGPGPAGRRGDTAERIEGARARPGGGDARVHRHPATPVPQRGCGRGRALLRGATGRPVPGPLSSAPRHPRPTAAGHILEEYPFTLCAI
jgi:enoyl-CoA hydratase